MKNRKASAKKGSWDKPLVTPSFQKLTKTRCSNGWNELLALKPRWQTFCMGHQMNTHSRAKLKLDCGSWLHSKRLTTFWPDSPYIISKLSKQWLPFYFDKNSEHLHSSIQGKLTQQTHFTVTKCVVRKDYTSKGKWDVRVVVGWVCRMQISLHL